MVEEDIEFETFDNDIITKSDYRDDIINDYLDAGREGLTKITDFTIGSEAYHLADIMAKYKLEFRELIDMCYRMAMIHTAVGEFLDNYGDMHGVHRGAPSPSRGSVTFTRLNTDDNLEEIIIPDGLEVSTEDAISFIVDNDGEDIILESGNNSIVCNVLCELEGEYTNVVPHSITLIMDDLGNMLSVDNSTSCTGGADLEDDEDYRQRILLSPGRPPAGTSRWFENLALTLDSVHDVRVDQSDSSSEYNKELTFHPVDWEDIVDGMTRAESELRALFGSEEYDIMNAKIHYVLAERVPVLQGIGYKFAVLLKNNYTLDMVKDEIIAKVNKFNADANVSNVFSPSILASIIENEVVGVTNCRIVHLENNRYTEVVSTTDMEINQIYEVDTTNLSSRIVNLHFNLDVEVEE